MTIELAPQQRYTRFNRWLVGLCVSIFAAVMALNLVVDPYNVFGSSTLSNGYTDNERYNKVQHMIDNPKAFNAFIVGSSRMGLYEPSDATALRPGKRYYNLAVFGGHAKDAHQMLKAIDEANTNVTEVVMGIDLFPFLEQDEETTPAYRHHPRVTGVSYFDFYKSYLFVPSITHAVLKIQQHRMTQPDILFDFERTGRFFLAAWDRRIEEDHEAFISDTFKASLAEPERRRVVWNERRFAELGALSDWLEQENIVAHFYVQPHHHTELDNYSEEALYEFRTRIESVLGEVPDFSVHEDWSTNNAWYYEPKHYRPVLAREVMRQLFGRADYRVASRDPH